jgi:hypothetical protein
MAGDRDFIVRHRLSVRQVAMVLAGGQIPLVRSSSRHLAHHVGGLLVVAQTPKPRVAELPVVGPFGEADRANQPRLDPVHSPAAWQVPAAERRLAASQPG